jgi:hypothetical protein
MFLTEIYSTTPLIYCYTILEYQHGDHHIWLRIQILKTKSETALRGGEEATPTPQMGCVCVSREWGMRDWSLEET